MSNFNWGIIVWFVIVGLLCGVIGYVIAPETIDGLSKAEIDAKISDAVEQAVSVKDTEIERLKGLLEKTENETTEEEEILPFGYLIDGLFLGDSIDEDIFSDRDVSTLFDGDVSFDGDDYDAEETLALKNITLFANEHDFEGRVYMTVLEGAIEYKLTFESDLNTSLIEEDETLVFNFLGERYEVSEWSGNYITLTKGIEHKLDVGASLTIGNKTLTLDAVSDDRAWILVDGEGKSIDEGKTKVINGLEIKVDNVFNSGTAKFAFLIVGEDIEVTIDNGEEYEEDSPWEYVITNNSIGLILAEDFTEIDLDGDEDFPAIGMNEKLCLPNDYVCIRFNGMAEEETEEYNLKLDEKSSVDYVRIDGNFQSGTKDYNRVYVRISDYKVFDRDLDEITGVIELGDTDSILITNATGLFFEDFNVNYDLNDSSVGTGDEDYLTDYGILVINPEDSIEDQEFNVFIPEGELEGSISVFGRETIEEAEDTTEEATNQTSA